MDFFFIILIIYIIPLALIILMISTGLQLFLGKVKLYLIILALSLISFIVFGFKGESRFNIVLFTISALIGIGIARVIQYSNGTAKKAEREYEKDVRENKPTR